MDLNPLHALDRAAHAVAKAPERALGWADREWAKVLPDHIDFTPNLPAYKKIPAAALAAAEARSKGATFQQQMTRGSNGGTTEPISFEIHATPDQLYKALEKAGWVPSQKLSILHSARVFGLLLLDKLHLAKPLHISYDNSPMSTLSLNGKPCIAAFEKNNDHHKGRDHLRVFDTGKRDAKGQPILAIAATRDTGCTMFLPKLGTTHHTDRNIDRERDLIMADLLKTGTVKDWRVAQGTMSPEERTTCDQMYDTDHKGYIVTL